MTRTSFKSSWKNTCKCIQSSRPQMTPDYLPLIALFRNHLTKIIFSQDHPPITTERHTNELNTSSKRWRGKSEGGCREQRRKKKTKKVDQSHAVLPPLDVFRHPNWGSQNRPGRSSLRNRGIIILQITRTNSKISAKKKKFFLPALTLIIHCRRHSLCRKSHRRQCIDKSSPSLLR